MVKGNNKNVVVNKYKFRSIEIPFEYKAPGVDIRSLYYLLNINSTTLTPVMCHVVKYM